jgi:3-(3-hydroxy-phenyl)propionate hydroxylase
VGGSSQQDLDVAIVGLGPVGAAAGALLAQRGLRVAAFEREKSVYHMPRAAHFDAEIMRVFQELGTSDALAACTINIRGMHLVNAEGRKLVGFDTTLDEGPLGWPRDIMFYQPELETILRRRALELGVAMHLGWSVEAIDADGGSLRLRQVDTGEAREVAARWVLGCDGARSLARAAIGGALEDLRCDQPWLVVDAILKRPVDLPPVAVQYCDPARPATFVPMPGARRRWEFMLMPGDTRESMERPERVRGLLEPWLGRDDAEIERAVVYTFHACLASPWRRGRVLVLGDAAHPIPTRRSARRTSAR